MLWFADVQHARPRHRADTCPFFLQSSCWVPSWASLQGLWRSSWFGLQPVLRAALSNNGKTTGAFDPSWVRWTPIWGAASVYGHMSFIHSLQMWILGHILHLLEILQICWVTASNCVCFSSKSKLKLIMVLCLAADPWTYLACYWIISWLHCCEQHFDFCLLRSLLGGQWALQCAHHLPG